MHSPAALDAPQPPVDSTIAALARELGTSLTVAAYLHRRGFRADERTRRFLDPKLQHLTLPDQMADRELAAERIGRAIQQREKVYVFGDYDCDGITSSAILTEVLEALGGQVSYGLASRFDGGYGVSPNAVKRILESGAKLLVTCDCGSSDHETLRLVRDAGVDVIVIDHHLVPDAPLPVNAFLNPHRVECGFAYKGLASCGLALSIAAALRKVTGQQLDLRRWLDLVAIGTIADVAPLDGDNRALVRAGLRRLSESPRPGLRALMNLAELEPGQPIQARDVAFRIAPRLNAPGRMGSPELALRLLLCNDAEQAELLAQEVEQVSTERKTEQQAILDEALAEIGERGWQDAPALTLGRQGWNHGIVGIVAGRLAEQFGKPVVVIGFEGEIGRGSVRGPAGARLHDALSEVSACLRRFGGHQAAAGLEVEQGRLEELRAGFEQAIARQASQPQVAVPETLMLEYQAGDDPRRVFADLMLLEPCGEANPRPELSLNARLIRAREVRGGHLKLELELDSGRRLSGFAVEQGKLAETLGEHVHVVGELRPDRYRGGDALEIRVRSVRSAPAVKSPPGKW